MFEKDASTTMTLIAESYRLVQDPKPLIEKINKCRTSKARKQNKFDHNPFDVTAEDFICLVYFVDPQKIRVKIYRLDRPKSGWSQSLQLVIANIETLHIGSNLTNVFEKEYNLQISVTPLNPQDSPIPKLIVQTGHSWDENNVTVQSFFDFNPHYKYIFYDDDDCLQFFQEHYPDNVKDYLCLVPSAYKADLFRYAFLLKHGGCYFDHKLICRMPINKFLTCHQEIVLCADWNYDENLDSIQDLYNAVIMVTPNHPLLKEAFEQSIYNIRNRLYLDGAFSITGPRLLKKCFTKLYKNDFDTIKFKHLAFQPWSNHKNMMVMHRKTQEIFLNKSMLVHNPKSGEYHALYAAKKIYNDAKLMLY
jgi:mannosyltransferase OCH1-like enzyme